MKIVVGLPASAEPEDVHQLAQAGAQEFFVGYVPRSWALRFGQEFSPNRRYFAQAQLDSLDHLTRLVEAAEHHGASVAVTFNEHFVTPEAMALGEGLLRDAAAAGCTSIIVADPSVLAPLTSLFPDLSFHLSGDAGVANRFAAEDAFLAGANRVILPRELSLPDLEQVVGRTAGLGREFEAFVMGEPCVFDGARCFTEHGYSFGCDFCNFHQKKTLHSRTGKVRRTLDPPQATLLDSQTNREAWGLGKCGLCALPRLARAGVTHVKVPGRASQALPAVRLVRRMLDRDAPDRDAGQELLAAPELCASGAFCYYPEVLDD